MDWGSVRKSFMIPEGYIYLNNGSVGPCARPVFEKTMEWQRIQESMPLGGEMMKIGQALQESKSLLADFVGMRCENFFTTLNLTVGMNTLAHGITGLQAGDEVIYSDQEYGSVSSSWDYYMKGKGVVTRKAEIPVPIESPDQIVEAFEKAFTPRTKLLAFSHISTTAIAFPVHRLCKLARERGIITVVDGAHAPGMVPLDIENIGCDYYIGNCHKWLCAPKGTAFVYAAPHAQRKLDPFIVHACVSPGVFADTFEYIGTLNAAQKIGIGEAVKFFKQIGFDAIVARDRELALYAREMLTRIPGVQPATSSHPDFLCPLVKYRLPPTKDEKRLTDLLTERRIVIPAWPENGGYGMRVSTHLYNTFEDVDSLVSTVRDAYGV